MGRPKTACSPLRYKVLARYSEPLSPVPCCVCCGTNIEVMLTIDHVEGAKVGPFGQKGHIMRGMALYKWIVDHHFPEGMFQVLCYNCNMAKYRLGQCPHNQPQWNPLLQQQSRVRQAQQDAARERIAKAMGKEAKGELPHLAEIMRKTEAEGGEGEVK